MANGLEALLDPKDVGRVEVVSYSLSGYGGDTPQKLKVTIYGKDNAPAQEVLMDVSFPAVPNTLTFTDVKNPTTAALFEQHFDNNTSPFMKDELETLKAKLGAYEASGLAVRYDYQSTNMDVKRDRYVTDKKGKTPQQIEALANQAHKENVFNFIGAYEQTDTLPMLPLPTAGTLFGEDKILQSLAKNGFRVGASDSKLIDQIKTAFSTTLANPKMELDGDKVGDLYTEKEVAFLKQFVGKLEEKSKTGTLTKHDINDYLTSLDTLSYKGNNLYGDEAKYTQKSVAAIAKKQGLSL